MFFLFLPAQMQQIQPYLDLRERFEHRQNRLFNKNVPDNRGDLYSRWRVGLTVPFESSWNGRLEYQYSHDLIRTLKRNSSTENSGISLAYAEGKIGPFTATVGRQKIAVGDERLIGPADWLNVPRSFDGVRFRGLGFDAWYAQIGVALPRPTFVRIGGLSYQDFAGTTTLFFKHDHTKAEVDDYTLDDLYKKRVGPFDLNFEGAAQAGKTGGKDLRAFALHGHVGVAVCPKLTPFVEANFASGGSSGSTTSTFDNLYPSNHAKYGIMDMQAWSNMEEFVLGADYRPIQNVSIRPSWHRLSLANGKDAWYNASGLPNTTSKGVFQDPTGQAGRDVGQELDLDAYWYFRKNMTLSAGVAELLPGPFVKAVSGQGQRQFWLYGQASARF